MDPKPVLLIAAGGTGGHMFPAQALAWEFQELGWNVVLVTDKRGEKFSKTFPPKSIKFIQSSATLSFKNPLRMPKALCLILVSILQASWVFIKIRPKVVIGFGGYPSFASILIAKVFKIKSIIHEQNAVLGRVNKFFSKSVTAVACSFWPTQAPSGTTMYFTGNPIRNTVVDKGPSIFNLPLTGPLNLVVIGGSQGAKIFSRLLPEAVETLPVKLRNRLRITHQARLPDCRELRHSYEKLGVKATVEDFFQNVERIFSSAHLIVARAGASTIAEVLFLGRPLLLVPIPFSLGDHQKRNAQRISDMGAAICLEQKGLTGKRLAREIRYILTSRRLAHDLANTAAKKATPQAIKNLKDLIISVSEGGLSAK